MINVILIIVTIIMVAPIILLFYVLHFLGKIPVVYGYSFCTQRIQPGGLSVYFQ